MDSWKTLFALSLVSLFCGCASEPLQNTSCDLQTLWLQQQRQIQRNLIAKDIATIPEEENPFRGSFGQRRKVNDPNDPVEVSLVNGYNKNLHDKEVDAWVTYLASHSVPNQSIEIQSSYGINRPYASTGTVQPNAYGLGVNADQYGRPTTYQLQNGQQLDPIFNNSVKQNAYGPGIGQDQFGRPVYNSH